LSKKTIPRLLVLIGVVLIAAIIVPGLRLEQPGDGFEVIWLGDTLLGDRAEQSLEEHGYDWAFARLPSIDAAALVVVNCESPLTVRNELPDVDVFYEPGSPIARYLIYTSRGEVTRYIYRSSPAAAQAMAGLGVDVATLANNHALDQGIEGLTNTRAALESAGIVSIGSGRSAAEALQPFITDTPHGRLAIFAFGEEGGTAPDATVDSAGICALNTANVTAARDLARVQGVDWMVAAVHWGNNYTGVLPTQEKWARRLAENDFNLVIGTGPHILQRVDIIGRTPVVYSQGNFVFSTAGRFTEQAPGYGVIVTTVLGPRGFRELRFTVLETNNKIVEYQPRPCDPTIAHRVLEAMWPDIRMEGAEGVLTW